MTLKSGATFGPYEIVEPIGAGGMGEVYRARDTRLDRDVALKVLPEGSAQDGERRARFEQEARSASALNHPHIVSLLDIGEQEDLAYIVMELVEGKTLRQLLASGPQPIRRVLDIAVQVAEGLAKAHSAGIVHRRPEARQRHLLQRRLCEDSRLRPRQADTAGPSGGLGRGHRYRSGDSTGRRARHGRLHVARAGQWTARGLPSRPVRAGGAALRARDGRAGLPAGHGRRDARGHDQGRARAHRATQAGDPSTAAMDHRTLSRQGSRRPVCLDSRSRSAAWPASAIIYPRQAAQSSRWRRDGPGCRCPRCSAWLASSPASWSATSSGRVPRRERRTWPLRGSPTAAAPCRQPASHPTGRRSSTARPGRVDRPNCSRSDSTVPSRAAWGCPMRNSSRSLQPARWRCRWAADSYSVSRRLVRWRAPRSEAARRHARSSRASRRRIGRPTAPGSRWFETGGERRRLEYPIGTVLFETTGLDQPGPGLPRRPAGRFRRTPGARRQPGQPHGRRDCRSRAKRAGARAEWPRVVPRRAGALDFRLRRGRSRGQLAEDPRRSGRWVLAGRLERRPLADHPHQLAERDHRARTRGGRGAEPLLARLVVPTRRRGRRVARALRRTEHRGAKRKRIRDLSSPDRRLAGRATRRRPRSRPVAGHQLGARGDRVGRSDGAPC